MMDRVFFALYTLLSFLLYLIAIPFLLLFSLREKYKRAIPARFFLWDNPPLKEDGIWFHSCSFGEARALAPLLLDIPEEFLRMSTTTQTGFEQISKYTSSQSRYLPYESLLYFWIKPQKALVVMEAEFWYLLFALSRASGAKTYLINARMSDRSYSKYLKMKWFYKKIFSHIDEIYAQTAIDKERLEALGAKHVKVTGNMKLAALPKPVKSWEKPLGTLVCAASTHEGEERLILEAFDKLKKKEPDSRLLVVPRHPERFVKVAKELEKFCKEKGYHWQRFGDTGTRKIEEDILLVDKLGELINLYPICDVVILGGAFSPIGGHNAAEAAQFGTKILSGPHYHNQRDVFDACEGISIVQKDALGTILVNHASLPYSKIKYSSDITPIKKSLSDVLYN